MKTSIIHTLSFHKIPHGHYCKSANESTRPHRIPGAPSDAYPLSNNSNTTRNTNKYRHLRACVIRQNAGQTNAAVQQRHANNVIQPLRDLTRADRQLEACRPANDVYGRSSSSHNSTYGARSVAFFWPCCVVALRWWVGLLCPIERRW